MFYMLKKPIQFGTETITKLTFRDEITAGDMRGLSLARLRDLPVDDVLKLAGRLTGQVEGVMNKLAPVDLFAVTEMVADFLAAGQETGNGSLPS